MSTEQAFIHLLLIQSLSRMTIMTGAWQTITDYKLVPLHTLRSMCSSWCSKSLSTSPSQSTSCMGCCWYTEMALIICYRMVQYLPALLVHTACAKVCPLQSMDSSILLGLASLCTSVYLPVEMTNMLIRSTGTYGDLPNNITNSTRCFAIWNQVYGPNLDCTHQFHCCYLQTA